MPGTTPEISDIYLIDFQSLGYGDAHTTARRSAVVSVTPVVAGVIGRESKKAAQRFHGDHIPSPCNPAHGFNLEGYWMSGHYKSILKHTFASKAAHVQYLATLTEPEASNLTAFVIECRRNKKIV
jgi:hypothetical protein